LPEVDPFNKTDRNYAFKYFFKEKIKGRGDELPQKKFLVMKVTNLLPSPQPIEIGLIDKNGSVLAGEMTIEPNGEVFRIPISTLTIAPFLIIPRPYPDFLPYKVQSSTKPFDWPSAETLQVVVKPGKLENVDLSIEKIWLE